MDFVETFPLKYFLNLAKRQDRRARCEEVFEDQGLSVRRFPAVNASFVRRARGFESVGRYAHAVSTRMILRQAMRLKAPAVFIFEDDVVLAPNLHERLAGIELPGDWGLFYLGCQHFERPEVVVPGLVKVNGALDTHAWGVRASHYGLVMRALQGRIDPPRGALPPADVFLARLHARVPSYAAFPNLAWQAEEHSDLVNGVFSNYRSDGTQKTAAPALAGVLAEALGGSRWSGLPREEPEPFYIGRYYGRRAALTVVTGDTDGPTIPRLGPSDKVALLFLSVGGHPHAGLWSEWIEEAAGRVSVFAHEKHPEALPEGWLKEAQIGERVETRWGDVSLVRAERALLRAALTDPAIQFFAFLSESCVPIRPVGDLLRLLALDGRSRFGWSTSEEIRETEPEKYRRIPWAARIPASHWRFHSQWVGLDREAAELVVEDDFTAHFANVFAPDECYFGTVLAAKGYPMEERVVGRDLTWTRWLGAPARHPETIATVTPELAAELLASGCFFARKFGAGSGAGALWLPQALGLPSQASGSPLP